MTRYEFMVLALRQLDVASEDDIKAVNRSFKSVRPDQDHCVVASLKQSEHRMRLIIHAHILRLLLRIPCLVCLMLESIVFVALPVIL